MVKEKLNLDFTWIVKFEFVLYMDSQKWFTLTLDSWLNCVWINYYPQTVNLTMYEKILHTDSRLHYLWSICLIQLIRWIHLILKPEKENTIVYIVTLVQLFALLKVLNLIIVMYLGSNDKFKLSFTRDIFWQSCLMTEKYFSYEIIYFIKWFKLEKIQYGNFL